MTPSEYVGVILDDVTPLNADERETFVASLRLQMENHVRQHLGENPTLLDSNMNIVFLRLTAAAIKTLGRT